MPAAHAPVTAVALQALPAGQGVQLAAPAAAYVPRSHGISTAASVVGQRLPAVHVVQTVASPTEYVPAGRRKGGREREGGEGMKTETQTERVRPGRECNSVSSRARRRCSYRCPRFNLPAAQAVMVAVVVDGQMKPAEREKGQHKQRHIR